MAKKKSGPRKRELMSPNGDKRYVRRNKKGQFKDVVDVGRSLRADRRSKAKKIVAKGQGDKGDVAKPTGPKLTRNEVQLVDTLLCASYGSGWARLDSAMKRLAQKLRLHQGGSALSFGDEDTSPLA